MRLAKSEAKNFIHWLCSCNHHGDKYENLGDALLSWCSSGDGARKLGYKYHKLLEMMIVLIMENQDSLNVTTDIDTHEFYVIKMPASVLELMVTKDDFKAIVKEKMFRR